MKKEYYYNLKLNEEETSLLSDLLCDKLKFYEASIEDKKAWNSLQTKLINALFHTIEIKVGDVIEDYLKEKEEHKCQNHK